VQKVKIGVIGTGHLGTIHSRLWKNVEDAALVGIYDIDEKKKHLLSKELKCRAFQNLEELIENCEAVTIAVPTINHYETAKICIENKIHCFIEKPITETYEEANQLIEFAKANKAIIQVGHVERFNPALSALSQHKLAPMFIEAHRLSQFKSRAIDVSVVHDLMIHDIDIMLWLVKSTVETIDANGVSVITNTPDIANARIKFKNGAVANLTASRISAHPMRKMRIFQPNAYISIDFGNQDVEVFRIVDKDEKIVGKKVPAVMLGDLASALKNRNIIYDKPKVKPINAIAEEQKSFIESIKNGSSVAVSAEEAGQALKIAELIAEQISGFSV
jgi:predicted dehydrogenase